MKSLDTLILLKNAHISSVGLGTVVFAIIRTVPDISVRDVLGCFAVIFLFFFQL